jgi:hypothetical protein
MAVETGQDVQLSGKSGETYTGKIYDGKDLSTGVTGNSIVCLTNSAYLEGQWHHKMNSIFSSSDIGETLAHFKLRDDISHLILIPQDAITSNQKDHVDDLIRGYLHS